MIKDYIPVPGIYPNNPASNNYLDGFKTSLMQKDMALALDCHDSVSSIAEFTQHAHDYYKEVNDKGLGDLDYGYIFKYLMDNKKI